MAAKKKGGSAPSVCAAGGGEQQPISIRVRPADVIEFEAWMCSTAADIEAEITASSGATQPFLSERGASHVKATLPSLAAGQHALVWTFMFVSSPWQTRTEVAVNGVNRFRQRKADTSKKAVNRGFLIVEVVP